MRCHTLIHHTLFFPLDLHPTSPAIFLDLKFLFVSVCFVSGLVLRLALPTCGPNPNHASAVRRPMSDRATALPPPAPVSLLHPLPRNARAAPHPNPSLQIYRPLHSHSGGRGDGALFCPVLCFCPDPICGTDGVTYWCNPHPARCSQSRDP
jgi:hypothetical protein